MKNNKAFTLIELLLGLMLFSLIGATAYSVFSGAMSLRQKANNQGDVYKEMLWSLDEIGKELENMAFYDFTNSYPGLISFNGSRDEISFLIALEDELRFVRYYLSSPDGGEVFEVNIGETHEKNVTVLESVSDDARINYLVREEISFVDFINGRQDDSSVEIMARNIAEGSLQFSFGYQEGEGASYQYKTDWGNSYNPSIVRVEMDYIVPEKHQRIPVRRNILVPTGYMGSIDENG